MVVVGGGCLGFQLPVSLFENETLFFYPGPPALGAHPLACIDHSWRDPYEEGGKKRISNQIRGSVGAFAGAERSPGENFRRRFKGPTSRADRGPATCVRPEPLFRGA